MPRISPTNLWTRGPILAAMIPALLATALILTAQEATAPYCSDLKQVAALAMTNERFASISSKPRDGNFADSRVALTGWSNCSVYAARIYTCDSQPKGSVQEAQQAQGKIFSDIQACLGNAWTEAKDRSSLGFLVLHHAGQPISITLSIDQTDKNEYVVRLILFGRSD